MENCKGNINNFCYVCGHFTPIGNENKRLPLSDDFVLAYEKYYSQKVNKDVPWAPESVCKTCYNGVLAWKAKKIESLPYGVPMLWFDPGAHDEANCYACVNSVVGLNKKKAKKKVYVAVPSAQLPLPHSDVVPIPSTFPSPDLLSYVTAASTNTQTTYENASEYEPGPSTTTDPILVTQAQLDHIVAKLELSQRKSEMLASFLKSNNLLANGTKVSAYRNRNKEMQQFFTVNEQKTFAYCNDVEKLMKAMDIKYEKEDWRLFIDSSKTSLKAVLLHKSNAKPSIPIAYSTDTKETYAKMQYILEMVRYEEHQWRICCDLKVVAILSGLQAGYTKFMCFLCDWNTRYTGDQYAKRDWKDRKDSQFKNANVIREALVPLVKILMPFLHIKLGIVKNFLTAVAKRDDVLRCLSEIFTGISTNKLKHGVVNGPDIRKLMKDERFEAVLVDDELIAWQSIKEVITGFLGKNRSENYVESVQRMLGAFSTIGVHMSLKIHYLHHHLQYFSRQLPSESDEQGERYHQTAIPFELRYRGKQSPDSILAEICWWSKRMFDDRDVEEEEEEEEEEEADVLFDDFIASDDESTDADTEIETASKRARR